jgi:hypothetical protein
MIFKRNIEKIYKKKRKKKGNKKNIQEKHEKYSNKIQKKPLIRRRKWKSHLLGWPATCRVWTSLPILHNERQISLPSRYIPVRLQPTPLSVSKDKQEPTTHASNKN